jgi:hypothetical protein
MSGPGTPTPSGGRLDCPMRRVVRACLVAVATVAALSGCAQSPRSTLGPASSAGTSSTSSTITSAELAQRSTPSSTALQAIQTLRPGFLTFRGNIEFGRGGNTQVSVDGGQLSAIDILATIPVSSIASIRYYSASDAMQKFGASSANAPVIEIRRK